MVLSVSDFIINQVKSLREQIQLQMSPNSRRPWAWGVYGYPETLCFYDYYNVYKRNAYAKALVWAKPNTCWSDGFKVIEGDDTSDADNRDQTPWEKEVSSILNKIKAHRALKLADVKQRVNQYSAIVIQIRGSQEQANYENELTGTLVADNIEKLHLFYDEHCKPCAWEQNESNPRYSLPTYYQVEFNVNENNTDDKQGVKYIKKIHWSRVIILSEGVMPDDLSGESVLEAPYNNFINLEKVQGGVGEGVAFNAAAKVAYETTGDGDEIDVDETTGEPASDEKKGKSLAKAMVAFRNKIEAALLVGKMKPHMLNTKIEYKHEYVDKEVQAIAASDGVPEKRITGAQTGRLAGDSDETGFGVTCKARQAGYCTDSILLLVEWLIKYNIVKPVDDISVWWPDLLAPSDQDKVDIVEKMTKANQQQMVATGEVLFSTKQMQTIMGYSDQPDDERDLSDLAGEDETD